MTVQTRLALFLLRQMVVFVVMMGGPASQAIGKTRTGETVIQKATEQFEDDPLTITSLSPGLFQACSISKWRLSWEPVKSP